MSQLVTGEAVAVDLRVARLPSRLTAAFIDLVIQLAILIAVVTVVGQLGVDPSLGVPLLILTVVGSFLVYPVVFETLTRGKTPGKMVMGLRVVRDDGGPIGFRHALVRGLLGLFVERPPLAPTFFVGFIAPLLNERGKRVGDMLAGTLVLQERIPSRSPSLVDMPPPLATWATTLDLSALPGDLALAVREFLGRAGSLTPAARDQLGRQLHTAVSAVVTPPPPPGTPGWAYLAAVIAERRRRDEERLRAGTADATRWQGSPPPGAPAPWGTEAPAGVASPWRATEPATEQPPVVGPPPADPGPPPPVPATAPVPGPFAPPA